MASNNIIQIYNKGGTLLLRNDLLPLVCVDIDEFPQPQSAGGLRPWMLPHNWKGGGRPSVLYSSFDYVSDRIFAVKPQNDNHFIDFRCGQNNNSGRGRTVLSVFTNTGVSNVEYYAFAQERQRAEDFGLQLYHPVTGELMFDTCWDVMLPVKILRLPTDGTPVAHGLKSRPAFIPLNTVGAYESWGSSSNINSYGVSCTETHCRVGPIAEPFNPGRFKPFQYNYVDILVIDVLHL